MKLNEAAEALKAAAASVAKSPNWADKAHSILAKNKECLVISHDESTRFVAEHLAEEFNVRYRAGKPFNRPDRPQIPCISCCYSERSLFPSTIEISFRYQSDALKITINEDSLILPLGQAPEFFVGLIGRVVMHAICEWFEPEFVADFNGSARLALEKAFEDCTACLEVVRADSNLFTFIEDGKKKLRETVDSKGFIFLFGNGGSATDSVELAEFGKSIGLPTTHLLEAGYVTCAYNDSHPVFARAFERMQPPHTAFAFSTSGASENVNLALRQAKQNGIKTIALCGKTGGVLVNKNLAESLFVVRNDQTQRIQEMQFILAKILFAEVSNA